MFKLFYHVTHACSVDIIPSGDITVHLKIKSLRPVDSVNCPLFSCLSKSVQKGSICLFSFMQTQMCEKSYMKYSAGDELVFKMILCFTKGLFIIILKMPISSINLTIWLEFLKLDFHSRDIKIQKYENSFHKDAYGYRFGLYILTLDSLCRGGEHHITGLRGDIFNSHAFIIIIYSLGKDNVIFLNEYKLKY